MAVYVWCPISPRVTCDLNPAGRRAAAGPPTGNTQQPPTGGPHQTAGGEGGAVAAVLWLSHAYVSSRQITDK